MCGVQFKDRKISKDMMLKLGLNETMPQLAMRGWSYVAKGSRC